MGTIGLLHTKRAPPILCPPHWVNILGTSALVAEDHRLWILSEQTDRDSSHLRS